MSCGAASALARRRREYRPKSCSATRQRPGGVEIENGYEAFRCSFRRFRQRRSAPRPCVYPSRRRTVRDGIAPRARTNRGISAFRLLVQPRREQPGNSARAGHLRGGCRLKRRLLPLGGSIGIGFAPSNMARTSSPGLSAPPGQGRGSPRLPGGTPDIAGRSPCVRAGALVRRSMRIRRAPKPGCRWAT